MLAPKQTFPLNESNVVQLVEASGEWFVRIVENGEQTSYRSFDKKRLAVLYAETERKRLGLQEVVRV